MRRIHRGTTILLALGLLACQGVGSKKVEARRVEWKHKGKTAELVLAGRIMEAKGLGAMFATRKVVLYDLLARMKKAAGDPKIGAILLRIENPLGGWAQYAEVRQALLSLRHAGKLVVAYLPEGSNGPYYLASAADKVVMPAGATLWLMGLRSEVMFFKGLLDKIGIVADFLHVGKFKGAVEPLTRSSMSGPLKESMKTLVDSLYRAFLVETARGRGKKSSWLEHLMAEGPHQALQAKKAGLIDDVMDLHALRARLGGEGSILPRYGIVKKKPDLSKLLGMLQGLDMSSKPTKPFLALVVASGPIVMSESSDPFDFSDVIAADKLVKALDDLSKEKKAAAVVLRIDSPGGSALASELIWQAVRRLDKVKPVVVSMGNVAASGGYYMASAARLVYAEPNTITGSIGVLGGKMVLAGLFKKIGVTVDSVQAGPGGAVFSVTRPFSKEERRVVQAMMERTYDLFVSRVAEGRHKSKKAVAAVAQGRVWAGSDAVRNGLVDRLGGLSDALAQARRLGRLGSKAPLLVRPRPKNPIRLLMERLGGGQSVRWAGGNGLDFSSLALLARLAPGMGLQAAALARSVTCLARERVLAVLPFGLWIH